MAKLQDLVVSKGGDAVIFYNGIEETKLTYHQLNRMANCIAQSLNKCAICQGSTTVGIYMEMGVLVPACILGILKAGCCFVYLSPSESPSFLSRIIDRANVKYLITDRTLIAHNWLNFSEILEPAEIPSVKIMKLADRSSNGSGIEEKSPISLAYIMFTSGTTGDSKMVRVPHSCIVPNILHLWNEYKLSSSDVIFLSSPLTFDPSIVDIFLALCSGARLLIVSDDIKLQPTKLADVLFERYRITVLQTTPTLLLRFPSSILKRIICPSSSETYGSLRILALGGEAFPCTAMAPYFHGEFINRNLRLYNLYGPTEVSCWSTCHRVKPDEIRDNQIPIGSPMLATQIRMEAENGHTIGQLCIGGESRYCFIDDEYGANTKPIFSRPTGDLAIRRFDAHGVVQYYLIGRKDEQTKRMGKRLNLRQIAQIIESNINVQCSSVILDEMETLRAFVQLHHSISQQHGKIIAEIRKAIRISLPNHCIPDTFHTVESIPMTKHGKIDKKALLRQVRIVANGFVRPKISIEMVGDYVKMIVQNYARSENADLDCETSIRSLGIDSVNALAIVSALEQWTGIELPKALELTLFGTISSLAEYVGSMVTGNHDSNGSIRRSTINSAPPRKRRKMESGNVVLRIKERCGRVRTIGQCSILSSTKNSDFTELSVKWKWDSGKCIDASPVIVEDLISNHSMVYIGSHSGNFACLDAETGSIKWLNELGNRIEASATITGCGKYVVVGCYDGCVYFFDRLTGEEWWRFQTGDAVKCTGFVDQFGHVYIGSHDHCLYKLDYEAKERVWSIDLGGAIFSSPISCANGRIFVATLRGAVYCLESESAAEFWYLQLSKPVFSSLLMSNGCVIAISVDGTVIWISADQGILVRKYAIASPVFSTPALIPVLNLENGSISADCLLVGSESGRLLCIRELDGQLLWAKDFGSALTSGPFPFNISKNEKSSGIVCVATKSGNVYLVRLEDGVICCGFDLGQEIFSSPIVHDGCIFVGCRNDFMYSLHME